MRKSKVSVIITTKDSDKYIASCINSAKKQTYPQDLIEIIVVDNDSRDNTKSIALKFTELVHNFGPERSAQRNFGIRAATGEYILYLDADMRLSINLISECVRLMEQIQIVGLYIPEIIEGKNFWVAARNFERSFYNSTVIDCVRFFKKSDFLTLGGFDETMSGPEDWDFDRRMRRLGATNSTKSCIYHNEGDFSVKSYINKKIYYATSFDIYVNKWGKNDKEIQKQLGAAYRLWGVFTENRKWKKLLSHPILTSKMYLLRIILAIRYVLTRKSVI